MSPEVQHETSGSKGRWFIDHGPNVSELTYSILSPEQVIADHTEVAPGHEGEGIGLKMLEAFIADARAKGYRIVPLCPFVNAQRRKHPDWADVFAV